MTYLITSTGSAQRTHNSAWPCAGCSKPNDLALDLKDLDSGVPTLLFLVDHKAGVPHLGEVVILLSLMHQRTYKRQPKEGRINLAQGLGSAIVRQGEEHVVSTARKQRQIIAGAHLASSCFLLYSRLSDGTAHSQVGLPSQLHFSRHTLTDVITDVIRCVP